MNYALKLSTNGNILRVPYNGGGHVQLSKEIGCEWIEIVRPRGYDYSLVVDEEGLLNDNEINPYASLMYGILEHGQPIVGTALMLKEGIVNGEPDLIGMTSEECAEAAQKLFKLRDKVMEVQKND